MAKPPTGWKRSVMNNTTRDRSSMKWLIVDLLGRLVAMALMLVGCAFDPTNLATRIATEVITEAPTIPSPTAVPPTEASPTRAGSMKIKLTVEDKVMTAALIDSRTAQDFVSLLPLTLTLEDYAGTEKISNLPKRLSTEGAPPGSAPSVGDIAYYAPWGNLALFYRDAKYANGLIILGKLDGGMGAFNVPGSVKVTVELIR